MSESMQYDKRASGARPNQDIPAAVAHLVNRSRESGIVAEWPSGGEVRQSNLIRDGGALLKRPYAVEKE